ncbi:HlyD family secretion protein [Phyllobacterium sp. YR620]|uniref:HlyD family type I secretion periplasmic adaptor subunit n=1 Tax=Phyllobacterium sp. YR620 TaxID=1881066 RepID=UPI0008801FB5|nr:HlyD family type I secretion periplasmic adaptor subunit [Phyllobacterium sp. YR620]SDP88687.1 HlyD family secretion protein [Phyllobacterium sp. YR620]
MKNRQALRNSVAAIAVADDEHFRLRARIICGLAFGFLLLAGAGGWAATAQLTGAVIASGSVKVDRNLKAIQHRDGGIVSEIAVREGDFVQKGQVMLRLDDAQTRAELAIIRSQLVELTVRKARLVSERDDLDHLILPERTLGSDQHSTMTLAGEERLLRGNRGHRNSQKRQLDLGIAQLGEEIKGLEAQRAAKNEEIRLVELEHGKIKGLADKKLIEGNRIYVIERELASLRATRAEAEAGIARARSRCSELQLQILSVDETARNEAQRELTTIEPKIAELNERRVAVEDRLSRTDIRAPLAGTINELAVHTIGGVVTPAAQLITLVPDNAKLKIVARIQPTDIDQVSTGQKAKLRFSAFNQRTTPEVSGTVAFVSPSTSTDTTTGQVYYLAEIEVSEEEMEGLAGNELKPGMPVEAFISTENRTALSFLSKPLMDQFRRAFREE